MSSHCAFVNPLFSCSALMPYIYSQSLGRSHMASRSSGGRRLSSSAGWERAVRGRLCARAREHAPEEAVARVPEDDGGGCEEPEGDPGVCFGSHGGRCCAAVRRSKRSCDGVALRGWEQGSGDNCGSRARRALIKRVLVWFAVAPPRILRATPGPPFDELCHGSLLVYPPAPHVAPAQASPHPQSRI